MATPAPTRLRKQLGLFDVYAISTGAMFSSGFFLLPGLAAAETGPSVVLAYLVAALFIMPAMLSVAELATAMPRAGGAYYFLDRALGPIVGTVGGLGTWFALVLKSAFALVGMGAYLAIYVDVPIEPLAVALTVLFMLVNIFGAKETSGLQRVLVAALVGIMAFFVVQGLWEIFTVGVIGGLGARYSPFAPFGFSGFMSTVGLVFVSYAGLTKVASVSEEVENPDRNIPLGMALSLATATFIYVVGVFIIVAVLEPASLRSDLTPVATAARAFFDWLPGEVGVILVVIAAIAAFASTGNAGILSASRYPLAMARDRLVSPRFGNIGRFGTPTFSILVTGVLMVAVIVFLDIEGLAKLASAFQLLLFALLNLAVIVMRESHIPGYDPGFRSPFYPWVQVVGLITPFWLIAEMGELAVIFTLAVIALCIGWYFWYAQERVVRAGAIYHTFARLGRRRYRGLDLELRGIVREKGLRSDDPFDEIITRAAVLDFRMATSMSEVIELASTILARNTGVSREKLRDQFRRETETGFMPIAHGAALPHVRFDGLERAEILLVRSPDPVHALDPTSDDPGALLEVHAIFFLVSPRDDPSQHLRLLGHLATHVDDPDFMRRWLSAADEQELKETLLREERSLSVRLTPGSPAAETFVGAKLSDLRLPEGTLIALVRRGRTSIVPSGQTELRENDRLTILGDAASIRLLSQRFGPRTTGETAGST